MSPRRRVSSGWGALMKAGASHALIRETAPCVSLVIGIMSVGITSDTVRAPPCIVYLTLSIEFQLAFIADFWDAPMWCVARIDLFRSGVEKRASLLPSHATQVVVLSGSRISLHHGRQWFLLLEDYHWYGLHNAIFVCANLCDIGTGRCASRHFFTMRIPDSPEVDCENPML